MSLRKGMIVKWSGINPCIGKLQKRSAYYNDNWVLNDTKPDKNGEYWDSCHESCLRPATENEKKKYRESGELILQLEQF